MDDVRSDSRYDVIDDLPLKRDGRTTELVGVAMISTRTPIKGAILGEMDSRFWMNASG
jgi:hypothetical protein